MWNVRSIHIRLGFSEIQLCSPFVCGQTLDEWISWEESKESLDAGFLWKPYNAFDVEVELEECKRVGKILRGGSLVVHECCAETMSVHRRRILCRANSRDEEYLADILNGLRRGKRTPIGIDAEGSVYWIFPGCNALFVSAGDTATEYGFRPDSVILKDLYMDNEIPVDDSCPTSVVVEKAHRFGKYDDLENRWWVYKSPEEIKFVMNWLSDAGQERILKKLIQQLFPAAAKCEAMNSAMMTEIQESKFHSHSSGPGSLHKNDDSILLKELSEDSDDNASIDPEAEFEEDDVGVRPKLMENEEFTEPKFRVNDNILVLCSRGDLLRDGKIYETQKAFGAYFYNVKFSGCRRPAILCNWFPENAIYRKTPSSQLMQQANYEKFVKLNAWWTPPALRTLNAIKYTRLSDRAGAGVGLCRGHITYSDSASPLALLKSALLTVEAALPLGCVDDTDDRWSVDFNEAWRNAVVSSPNASALMECQLSLEFSIKTGWFRPLGSKLLASLPSRAHSAKYATYSLVALRLWTLDQSLRYEKVILPNGERPAYYQKEKSNRGRKPKNG